MRATARQMTVPTQLRTNRAHTMQLAERDSVARDPALPQSARRAVVAMYAGLALTLVAMIVPIVDQASTDSLSRDLQEVYAGYDVDAPATSAVVAYLVTIGGLGVAAWLWMARAVRKHKRWVRPAATALFVLASGLALLNLTVQEYGRTILPTRIGLIGLLPCLAGLVAVALLWRRGRQ
jgi:hypothetical protein